MKTKNAINSLINLLDFSKKNQKSKRKLTKIILIAIIALAALLRIPYLDKWPEGFSQDEAAKGYNAYSILRTGRSFRGRFLPLYFDDFSDKLPSSAIIYTYAAVPSVAIFGLNEFATKLPAAIFGTMTVVALYYLCQEIFKRRGVALFSAFFLSISPWHILMSRVALEPVTFPFFFLLGWFLVERGINKSKSYLICAGIANLAGSMYSYQTGIMFTPIFLFTWLLTKRDYFRNHIKTLAAALTIAFTLIIPLASLYLKNPQRMLGHYGELSSYISPILKTKIATYLVNYALHLNPSTLCLLYFAPVLFLAGKGTLRMLRERSNVSSILYFFLSLLPPSFVISGFAPYPTRSIGMIGFVEMFAGVGLYQMLRHDSTESRVRKLSSGLFLIITNAIFLLLIGFPKYLQGFLWLQQGFKETIREVGSLKDSYQKVIFTDKANQPFIYVLFYEKYPPEKFLTNTVNRSYISKSNPYERVMRFDKYKFCNINKCYKKNKNLLYVARSDEKPGKKEIKIIDNPDGTVFRIFAGN